MMGTGRTAKSYGYLFIIVSPANPRTPRPNTIGNASVGRGRWKSKAKQGGEVVQQGLEEGALKVAEGWGYLRWASILVLLIGVDRDVMVCGTSAWSLG